MNMQGKIIERLQMRWERFSHLALDADIAAPSLIEVLWLILLRPHRMQWGE